MSYLERLCTLPLYSEQVKDGQVSLLNRYFFHLKKNSRVITQLARNYRSHPTLVALPSRLFYNNSLIAAADKSNREMLCNWSGLPKKDFPLFMYGLNGRDERVGIQT